MVIKKAAKAILKAMSADEIDIETSRGLADLKRLDPMKGLYKTVDTRVRRGDYLIPIRIFFPEDATENRTEDAYRLMLFFHGGGWATDHVDNYERICEKLATETDRVVVSVEYRLAPEYKFPTGLEDCYHVAKVIHDGEFILKADWDEVVLIGDSAGGNLAAAVSLMARDRKEFLPRRQILVYPAVNNDYTENSRFDSVRENGQDYILTSGKMIDYMNYYIRDEEDLLNPYLAPILAEDLSDQPDTLILTAEFDPLRDEGEAYARRLVEAGNKAEAHRIQDAVHGYFALGLNGKLMQESMDLIQQFLEEE